MTGSDTPRSRAHRNTTVPTMRAFTLAAIVLVVACTSRESASSRESAASVSGPDSPSKLSHGHLQLTGDATVDTDFAVGQCSIGPPGDGPLNGYHMSAKAGHGTLQLLSIAVKNYDHDGSFTPAVDTGKVGLTGKHGVSGPLSMMIGRENSTVPLPVITGVRVPGAVPLSVTAAALKSATARPVASPEHPYARRLPQRACDRPVHPACTRLRVPRAPPASSR